VDPAGLGIDAPHRTAIVLGSAPACAVAAFLERARAGGTVVDTAVAVVVDSIADLGVDGTIVLRPILCVHRLISPLRLPPGSIRAERSGTAAAGQGPALGFVEGMQRISWLASRSRERSTIGFRFGVSSPSGHSPR
jgi:hypothetical protein